MTDQTPTPPSPGWQPGSDPKAAAKAAKAYAKASRPWWKKKRFILLGVIVLIIVIVVGVNSGGSDDGTTAQTPSSKAAQNSGKKSSGETNAYGSAKLPLQNGDWRLDSIKLKNDGLGDFGGTARITYTGDDKDGGDNMFTITVFKKKQVVSTLTGSANTVMPGTTATVQLVSTDKFVGGPYKYDFQNDL